jgi:hypothetical protein
MATIPPLEVIWGGILHHLTDIYSDTTKKEPRINQDASTGQDILRVLTTLCQNMVQRGNMIF